MDFIYNSFQLRKLIILLLALPFGQLPIFEEHGKVYNQTVAIARYLAKKIKIAGNNNWEDLELDALVDTLVDLLQKVSNFYNTKDQQQREQLEKSVLNETIPFYLARFEEIAKKNFGFLAFGRLRKLIILLLALPFGQLPIFEEHGKVYNQTVAICTLFVKKIKIAGNNNWEDFGT
ncbi:glutathione s-transferase [Holotrichia oblita]|uniref:Glutathione s-transferase n=1 Tax=Holotrichia oblita TaxID=644536 RepID=A0ACB9TVS8_HOLOL|nr:glutathione s-transferase [Holotrichia oblita]